MVFTLTPMRYAVHPRMRSFVFLFLVGCLGCFYFGRHGFIDFLLVLTLGPHRTPRRHHTHTTNRQRFILTMLKCVMWELMHWSSKERGPYQPPKRFESTHISIQFRRRSRGFFMATYSPFGKRTWRVRCLLVWRCCLINDRRFSAVFAIYT